jgi:FlaG/FlaF family flagellin (archaellin)
VNKNNFFITVTLAALIGSTAMAQVNRKPAQQSAPATKTTTTAKKAPAAKKNIKIDFESDTVTGTYDVPDASFINSRKMIKYKELFNKRTNFIDEIDANKGLFNEY